MRPLVPVLLIVAACNGGSGVCDPTSESCSYSRELSTTHVDAGQEIVGLCQSWTLNNPTELWVSNVTMDNGGAYHHSNWFFVPDNLFDVPDGAWNCADENFDELTAAAVGGVLFAQSTQVAGQDQTFPAGAAVRIPPWSRIVGSTHILNASTQPVDTHMTVSFDTIPKSDVTHKLAPARIEYDDLHIDPMATSSFTTTCDLADTYQTVMGTPLDYKIYYALPHYHRLGIAADLTIAGGAHDGESILHADGFGEAQGVAFDPPIDLGADGANGLRYSCTFMNDRSTEVGWGVGDQEMCVLLVFAETQMAFEGNAQSDTNGGADATGTFLHTSPCSPLGFQWDFNKPGGPPR